MTEPTTPPAPTPGEAAPPTGLIDTDVTEQSFDSQTEASPEVVTDHVGRHALVIGEALIDVVRRADGSVDAHPGGSPANVALTLGRLGRQVDLLTWFGEDDHGRLLRSHLEASGVSIVPGSEGAPTTSTAVATLGHDGAATYTFDLSWHVPERWASPPAPPLVIHTGSIGSVLEPGGQDVARILSAHRESATITYDPNLRPSLMPPAEQTRPMVSALVEMADVVKVSDEDLIWLEPTRDPLEVVRQWARSGPAIVIMTRGGEGATAVTSDDHEVDVAAQPVVVADTVGAGDSFMGGLIDGLWSAGLLGAQARTALRAVDAEVLRTVLERCVQIAAITVSRPGANPPTAAELTAG